MSEIPEDIKRSAKEVAIYLGSDSIQNAWPIIAGAILAERKASVEAVLDALLGHELYKYRPSAFKGFVTYARETFCPEFRGEA